MKLVYFLPFLLIFLVPQAFAVNSLENESLFAESGVVSLDLKFGEDDIRYGYTMTYVTNTIEDIILKIYGDEIPIPDAEAKVSPSGKNFRVSSLDEGIVMYGHFNEDLGNYKINIYIAGSKHSISTSDGKQQTQAIEPANTVVTKTNISLNVLTDQYERVYNKSDYKFFVKTFDSSIYSGNDFSKFQGKVSGAKVSAIIIDPNGEVKSDMTGFVENGIYEGSVYVPENLWQRGWYTVDIVVEYEGKFYQEQLSFYVFGEPVPSGDTIKCPTGTTLVNGACV